MKLTATETYIREVTFEVPDNATREQIRDAYLAADPKVDDATFRQQLDCIDTTITDENDEEVCSS